MAVRSRLYRLCRDDENPMTDGIKAKSPLADVMPLNHIRYGSQFSSQWISTSRYLQDVDNFIKLKRRKDGMLVRCKVVEIDEQKLRMYADIGRNELQQLLQNFSRSNGKLPMYFNAIVCQLIEETTGDILDFTDHDVMNKYIPVDPFRPRNNVRARGYATKTSEVLVERFIPASCCIGIHYR